MGGDGGSLSMLGIALTIIFVLTLLAQLFYALWRRRVLRCHTHAGGGAGAEHLSSCSSSKKLLYFFSIRRHPRLDSNSVSVTPTPSSGDPTSNRQLDMEIVDIDLLKLQGILGPPRFLFTIKEEEREGLESPADKSLHYSSDKEEKKIDDYDRSNMVSSEECFQAADSAVELEADGAGDDATPFSSPCSSPMYFTPSPSPVYYLAS
ncbi:hypothetical protein C2S51_031013 [Perilla frutescens var. frutescens]|nr:hypothetical protein C2S51_031013 [Perilla frutescens var. frutescens]